MARWKGSLAMVLAKANACQVYMSGSGSFKSYRPAIAIVGRPSDADKVRYLYAYLVRETERLCEREGRGCGRTWRNNFRYGVVEAIGEALKASKQRAADELRREAGADLFALVKVDRALTRVEKRAVDVERWVKQNLKLRTTRAYSRGNASARAAGRRAGKEINLNSARGSLTSGSKSLTS
jgi:hypothetical protein